MKRQRGRGRKPGNNNNTNRNFESNGPDIKVRGNASTIYEKYIQLARDATSSGDRVIAENYFQHAEHYLRIIQANQPRRDENQHGDYTDQNDGSDRDTRSESRSDNRPDNRGDNRSDGRSEGRGDQRSDGRREQRGDRPDTRQDGRQDTRQDNRGGDEQRHQPRRDERQDERSGESDDDRSRNRARRGRRRRDEDQRDESAGQASDPLQVVDPEADAAASAGGASQAAPNGHADAPDSQPEPPKRTRRKKADAQTGDGDSEPKKRTRRRAADPAAEDALKAAESKSEGGSGSGDAAA